MKRGKWAARARALQSDPGAWHLLLEHGSPSRVKYAQHRLKALGCEAVTEWYGLDSADLKARWPV